MDVTATRKANFRQLIAEIAARHPGWREKDVALALNLSPAYYTQLKSTRVEKKIGDDTARNIERAYNLPHGWMDVPRGLPASGLAEDTADYAVSRPLRIDPETIAAALQLVRQSFENLGLEIDQEANGLPLALAYDFLIERSERDVTVTNLLEFKPRLERLRGGSHAGQAQDRDRGSRTGTG